MILAMMGLQEIILIIISLVFMMVVITVVTLVIMFLYKRVFPTGEKQQKEVEKMKLSTVRSQLNPHFMFNALAGIQNLMNKNDIDNANRYLGKFARLTRNVLEAKEQISIAEEMRLLDDYLQMEQLRFGFTFQIDAEYTLDTENIEIPSMLLQPFAENAVKHGIANLKEPGNIMIKFSSKGNDLTLAIFDNGHGFKANSKSEGHGIKLMRSRIALFNSINKHTKMMMNINSGNEGTTVVITLTNWL
ncbi:hypothetical protein FA047_19865 [Pedobacter frigoris]|uniref:Signal transduction histidine kinase internal region domain-containing protein n=2 Tax=Pedobacter frigoris TaxID=2571272 RepID=A0A4U1CF54_9SPHI|nr:hypothetical protein FA047_19865 [Pedobacter frigoris]